MATWIIKGNPRENVFEDMLRAGVEDEWRTMRPPKGWVEGDHIFFWASSPRLELVGLGEFRGMARRLTPSGEAVYRVRYLTDLLDRPLGIRELRAEPVLRDAAFLKVGPATSVLPLRDAEADRLYDLVVSRNGPSVAIWGASSATQAILADVDYEVLEGEPRLREHLARERNREIVRRKKDAVKRATGHLACEACGFDFGQRYGRVGADICEVHHRVGLASGSQRITRLADLAILCSNCHRVIHRIRPMPSVANFRKNITIDR